MIDLEKLSRVSRSEYLDFINSEELSHSDFRVFEGFRTSAALYFKGHRCVAKMVETKGRSTLSVNYYVEAKP